MAERMAARAPAHYAMLGEPMSGVIRRPLGIATTVLPADQVRGGCAEIREELSTGPTRSYAAIRTLLKRVRRWRAVGGRNDPGRHHVPHSSEDARRGRTARRTPSRRESSRRRSSSTDDEEKSPLKVDVDGVS